MPIWSTILLGCNSIGRVPDSDSGCSGFKSLHPRLFKMWVTRKNVVWPTSPSLRSRAAFLLLRKKLMEKQLQEWLDLRDELLDRRGLVCEYCGKKDLKKEVALRSELKFLATIDHVVPKCEGGTDHEDNLKVACFPCNQRKSNLSIEKYMVVTARSPKP